MNYIVTLPDGSTNTIVADEAFVTEHFPGKWVLAPDQPDNSLTNALKPQLSRRAFQNRFPASGLSIASTKYDAMTLFLTDSEYAAECEPDAVKRRALKLDITTGLNRMQVSGFVDLTLNDAANFTGMLLDARIPADFRLTIAERESILDASTITDEERFQ